MPHQTPPAKTFHISKLQMSKKCKFLLQCVIFTFLFFSTVQYTLQFEVCHVIKNKYTYTVCMKKVLSCPLSPQRCPSIIVFDWSMLRSLATLSYSWIMCCLCKEEPGVNSAGFSQFWLSTKFVKLPHHYASKLLTLPPLIYLENSGSKMQWNCGECGVGRTWGMYSGCRLSSLIAISDLS